MKELDFDKFYSSIKRGQYPALTGNHLTKEQYDKIYDELKWRKEQIDHWIERVLQIRVENKEDRRTD